MPCGSLRDIALSRCLDLHEPVSLVATQVGVPQSTLRGWLRTAQLQRQLAQLRADNADLRERHQRILLDLQRAAAALALLRSTSA